MAKKKTSPKKVAPKASSKTITNRSVSSTKPRKLKTAEPRFNFFPFKRKQKPAKIARKPLPSSFRIFITSLKTLQKHWRLFTSITLIYGLLNLIFVKGFATAVDLSTLKSDISGVFHGNYSGFGSGLGSFLSLFGGTSGTSSPTAGAYQAFLVFVVSLAVVWTLRQVYAGQRPFMRDGFYKGAYPLVPVMLIVGLISIQLVPFAIGTAGFSTVVAGGIVENAFEAIITGLICVGLVWLSLRWLAGSVMALYIVTLPDMTPMTALRSARELVYYRRRSVCLKLIFLPVILFIIASTIMIPIILFVTAIGTWVFFILTIIGLSVIHSYYYSVYRELL